MRSLVQVLDLPRHGDERGWLVAVDTRSGLPFTPVRAYYCSGVPAKVRRGGHAHRQTYQAAICVAGACTFSVDDGRATASLRLDRSDRALLLPPYLWHEMFDFTSDCILLVVASLPFDEADYIRSYSDFRRLVSTPV